MNKFLGVKDGYSYYLSYDEIDDSGLFNPLNDDNLWTLLTFTGCGYTLDKDVNGLDGLDAFLIDKYGVCLPDNKLDDLRFKDEYNHISESGFFDDLHNLLLKYSLYCEPITKSEHDSVYFNRGVGCGFDSGVCGVAIISKHNIREFCNRKRVTKKLLKSVYKDLDVEFNHINDDNNGMLYCVSKQKNGKQIDSIGGIYCSDLNCTTKEQLNRVANLI